MTLIIWLLIQALNIYFYLILAAVVVSWLAVFEVLNMRNKWVYKGSFLLNRLTLNSPPFLRLRRVIPPLGGFDVSPMVIIVGLYLLQGFLLGLL